MPRRWVPHASGAVLAVVVAAGMTAGCSGQPGGVAVSATALSRAALQSRVTTAIASLESRLGPPLADELHSCDSTSAGADLNACERAIGADFRVRHQPRQFVRGGPAPVRTAALNLGEIILRAAVVGDERSKPRIHEDRHANHGHRNQKELNSEGGRGAQRVSSRRLALDQLFHGTGRRQASEYANACKFYYVGALRVKGGARLLVLSAEGLGIVHSAQ